MSTPALTNPPQNPTPVLPMEWDYSYIITTPLAGDIDLTAASGTPSLTNGATAGPFKANGMYSRGVYAEVAGAIVGLTKAGVQDTWNVPANSRLPVNLAYIIASGTTATGIHVGY